MTPAERETPETSEPLEELLRWERSGALWRVLDRQVDGVTVGLFSCDGGEEMGRLATADDALRRYVADRNSSEE